MIALPEAFFEQENEPMDVFKHAKKIEWAHKDLTYSTSQNVQENLIRWDYLKRNWLLCIDQRASSQVGDDFGWSRDEWHL